MHDLDALLKEFEQPKKSTIKENLPQHQQKLPIPNISSQSDSSFSDNRKGNNPKSNFSLAPEQHRTSILKKSPRPSVDQSLDIDAILQGRPIQPQQPAKKSASSTRRDSLIDWLNEDRSTTKNSSFQPSNLFSHKVTTNLPTKSATNLDPDDFFSNTNNRDQSATNAPLSTTKPSAKQYYMENSRYKPGKKTFYYVKKRNSTLFIGINSKQPVRGDGFNWLMDPSDNSNSACMSFSSNYLNYFILSSSCSKIVILCTNIW
jgi:hypothetical protein